MRDFFVIVFVHFTQLDLINIGCEEEVMRFSVLLSVYEKENPNYFEKSLESILQQSILPSEIVIVQDGSLPTKLYNICKYYYEKYPKLIKIISLEENCGLGMALQIGLTKCSFNLVARMDTDDIAKPERFEKQVRVFQEDKEVAIVGSYIDEFSESVENVESIRKVPITNSEIKQFAKMRNPFNHMTVMFRKSAVLDAGNYQPFHLCEDYYLWFRMLVKGYKMKNLPESLVFARVDKNMFKRRGGLKYFLQEIKLQNIFYKSNFISFFEYVRNIVIRVTVRLMPNTIRGLLYRKCIR